MDYIGPNNRRYERPRCGVADLLHVARLRAIRKVVEPLSESISHSAIASEIGARKIEIELLHPIDVFSPVSVERKPVFC